MHVRDLASNQFTNEDVGTLANRFGSAKNLFPFWMAPTSCPGWDHQQSPLRDLEQGPCGLEDDSVAFNKCERFLLVHNQIITKDTHVAEVS